MVGRLAGQIGTGKWLATGLLADRQDRLEARRRSYSQNKQTDWGLEDWSLALAGCGSGLELAGWWLTHWMPAGCSPDTWRLAGWGSGIAGQGLLTNLALAGWSVAEQVS